MVAQIFQLVEFMLLCALTIPCTLFPFLYFFRSPWKQTVAGQAALVASVGMMLLVDISVAGHFIKHMNLIVGQIITISVFTLILVGEVWQLIALLKNQRKK